MRNRPRNLLSWLLFVILASPVAAAPPTFADKIAAIATAEATELARLDQALATTADQAEVVALQRCATYVKLASRLALHEAQLAGSPQDPAVAEPLADLVEDLRTRVEAQKSSLPADYAFAPLAAIAEEVPPCAE